MSYYSDVCIAFTTEDWDKEIYQRLLDNLDDVDKSMSMEKIVKGESMEYPDLFVHNDDYTIIRWTFCNHWNGSWVAGFMKDIAADFPCDYIITGEEPGDIEYISNELGIIETQGATPLAVGQPYLEDSWRIISALVKEFKKELGYDDEDIKAIVNDHTKDKLGNKYDLSLIMS